VNSQVAARQWLHDLAGADHVGGVLTVAEATVHRFRALSTFDVIGARPRAPRPTVRT
jgi:hypothetical protein